MNAYTDTIALASAKIFAEFQHLLDKHDDSKEACDQMIEQAAGLLDQAKPANAREWAEKTIRSMVSQFLISLGHTLKELADAEISALKKAKQKKAHPARRRSNDNLPTIQITEADIKEAVDRSESALLAADRGVYQRGGAIVSVSVGKGISTNGEPVAFQSIAEIGDHALVEHLSCAAHYEKWDSRLGNGGDWRQSSPPMWVVKTLQQRAEKRLPPLVGIISAPTMRPDGTILSEPGYDRKTGLLFDQRGVAFPDVPDRPTREQALAALAVIKEPISKFPFVSEVDRSVALSAVFTALVRRTLATAPLHAFSATAAGSGKGKLVDYASIIATGEEAPIISQGDNDEETEKRIGTCVLDGRPLIAIDNCKRPLTDVDILCSMLTQATVSPRILGLSKMPMLPGGAFVTCTGNGLTVVGDMTRRTVRCDIDAGCERPELRTFEFDPAKVAKSKRAGLVVAALTVLRAFHVTGRPVPEGVSPLGSFDDWSLLVRNALIWVDCADPVVSIEKLREDDPERNELADVMTHWWEAFGDEKVTTPDVISRACEYEPASFGNSGGFILAPFRDALLAVAAAGGAVSSKRLGRWLLRNKGRIVAGRRFEQRGAHGSSSTWRLMRG
jgi:hypothetical protein